MQSDILSTIAWVGANLFIAYIAVVVVLFVFMYYIFFDPKATTAGRMIFRFMLSLVGVMSLVFIGIFIDPSITRQPFSLPDDQIASWRPFIRFVVYAYVSFTITSLATALVLRKWYPEKVKKKSDLALVKPRNDAVEAPISKK